MAAGGQGFEMVTEANVPVAAEAMKPQTSEDDAYSYPIQADLHKQYGLAEGFALRRHKHEIEADEGSREARADWVRYIGPVHIPGGCNPFSGHFSSLVLPTCRPGRLRIISYVFEYAFIHDVVMESASKDAETAAESEEEFASRGRDLESRSMIGSKQIQSKIVLQLLSIDNAAAQVIDEYLKYRIVDTGAPFVDKHMCFGMGMVLSESEMGQVEQIAHAAYAALGLENDYFSFDVEYDEFRQSDKEAMTNAVWLFMHWNGVGVAEAKQLAWKEARNYELKFLRLSKERAPTLTRKLQRYVQGLAYQIAGNVAWSTDNPRYHPEKDIYAHDMIDFDRSLATYHQAASYDHTPPQLGLGLPPSRFSSSDTSRRCSYDNETIDSLLSKRPSVASSKTSVSEQSTKAIEDTLVDEPTQLPRKHVISAPFEYISSLPSKGARGLFIDALTVWMPTEKKRVEQVKEVIKMLHNVSLMLDDIEDGSALRRGRPSTHSIFGASQTINSAGYFVLEALQSLREIDAKCVVVALDYIQDLYLGQSYDLYWTRCGTCPTELEYLDMVDKKTGGLFQLAAHLLQDQSGQHSTQAESLVQLLGRYFQIRDNYKNLGKYSFPLIHALHVKPDDLQLPAVLQSRKATGALSIESKKLVLQHLEERGSLSYTQQVLENLERHIYEHIGALEASPRGENWIMRLLMHKLKV